MKRNREELNQEEERRKIFEGLIFSTNQSVFALKKSDQSDSQILTHVPVLEESFWIEKKEKEKEEKDRKIVEKLERILGKSIVFEESSITSQIVDKETQPKVKSNQKIKKLKAFDGLDLFSSKLSSKIKKEEEINKSLVKTKNKKKKKKKETVIGSDESESEEDEGESESEEGESESESEDNESESEEDECESESEDNESESEEDEGESESEDNESEEDEGESESEDNESEEGEKKSNKGDENKREIGESNNEGENESRIKKNRNKKETLKSKTFKSNPLSSKIRIERCSQVAVTFSKATSSQSTTTKGVTNFLPESGIVIDSLPFYKRNSKYFCPYTSTTISSSSRIAVL